MADECNCGEFKMIYYGGNDYRDYLAHHGVLGMHWGIRRYQPYSIGYQRKGGEDGKEIGQAKSNHKNSEKKTSYNRQVRTESDYVSNKTKSKIDQAEQKYESLANNYKPTKSQKDFDNKMEAPYEIGHTYDGQSLIEEIKTKSGDWYHGKPIGEHSKAAAELLTVERKRADEIEDSYFYQKKDMIKNAQDKAVAKIPKLLRGSKSLVASVQNDAKRKVQQSKEYKNIDKKDSSGFKERSARKYAANRRVVAAALRDMGYPVTDENIKKIWDYIIVD